MLQQRDVCGVDKHIHHTTVKRRQEERQCICIYVSSSASPSAIFGNSSNLIIGRIGKMLV